MSLSDFAGCRNLHMFGFTARWVNPKNTPGDSHLEPPTMTQFCLDALLQKHMWAGPNFVWVVMSILVYIFFPYDLSATGVAATKGPLSREFFAQRFPLWLSLVMGYFAFWHITLHILGWGKRSFIPNRPYRLAKVLHNVFYCFTGVVIWVWFENVFCFLWATGRLPYMTDSEAFGTASGLLRSYVGLSLVPLWRDFHFYFAHRLIHFRPLFQQIHSLHHRNTDVEPFSGLCMHPIEHLYYYASVMPSVFLFASPLHCLWNAMHFLIAPAASHSGYEDHFQADPFHYYHHRYFEVNYAGLAASYLDNWFGSFYGNGWRDKEKDGTIRVRDDAKADINVIAHPPTFEFVLYMTTACGCVAYWMFCAMNATFYAMFAFSNPYLPCIVASFGPVVIAVVMQVYKEGGVTSNLIAPFQKRPMWETALHVVCGTACCSVTVLGLLIKVF